MNAMKYGIQDIDHVVSAVADPESAGELLSAMGFTVTPLSVMNNVGVANRLVLFQPQAAGVANFIELMGVVDPQKVIAPLRPFLRGVGGYRWLVLSGPDAASTHERLVRERYPFGEPIAVKRDWVLPTGEVLQVAFNVMMPIDAPIPFNFCEYRTLQHYIRPEFLNHPNGAEMLTGILCESQRPQECQGYFETLFGTRCTPVAKDIHAVTPGHVDLLVGDSAAWQLVLGRKLAPSANSPHKMLGCRIKVRDLAQTETWLRRADLPLERCSLGLIVNSPIDDGTCFVFHG